jgi:hypothetical protein
MLKTPAIAIVLCHAGHRVAETKHAAMDRLDAAYADGSNQ